MASSKELSQDVYKKAAQKFLQNKAVKELGQESTIAFLQERKSGAQKLLAETLQASELEKETRFFDKNFTALFSSIKTNESYFQVVHQYAQITNAYRMHALRKHCGCYSDLGVLADFEQQYKPPLEKISLDEFKQRIKHSFTNKTIEHLLFTTSEKIAQAALDTITAHN